MPRKRVEVRDAYYWALVKSNMSILPSGCTILFLLVYRDPDGIKIDSVGTNRRKWREMVGNVDVVFITWFHGNYEIALLYVYPIEWNMYFFARTHTNTWSAGSIMIFFWRAQDLERMTWDQNRLGFRTIMQLVGTFQHLPVYLILKFVNVRTNYFDRLIANQKLAL